MRNVHQNAPPEDGGGDTKQLLAYLKELVAYLQAALDDLRSLYEEQRLIIEELRRYDSRAKNLLTLEEVARLTGVSARTVQRWIVTGELPALDLSDEAGDGTRGRLRVHPEVLDVFFRTRVLKNGGGR